MVSLGHTLRQAEISKDRVVIEEASAIASVWLFGGFAVGMWIVLLLLARSLHPAVIFVPMCFGLIALYASVQSSFVVDRPREEFVLRRKILLWEMRKVYRADAIHRFFVEHRQKGSGLAMHLKNGKKKILSMSATFDSQALDHAASALNHGLPHRERP